MEMIKMLITAEWKIAQSRLDKIRFYKNTNRQITKCVELEQLIVEKVRLPSQLAAYIKAMKERPMNPYILIKEAIFLHLYLQQEVKIDQSMVIQFLKYLLQHCHLMTAIYGQFQTQIDFSIPLKSTINRDQMTTREDQIFISKEVFLLTSIIKSYIGYIFKIVSIYSIYQSFQNGQEEEKQTAWMILNLLHLIISFTKHFTIIGRYFLKDYGMLVVLLTETFTKDIVKYLNFLKAYIYKQNCMLTCSMTEENQEIEQFIEMLNQITKLNQQLIQIYLGKYFFAKLAHIKAPEWINTNCSRFDTIFKAAKKKVDQNKINQMNSKQTRKNNLNIQDKQIRQSFPI